MSRQDMMMRILVATLACSAFLHAQVMSKTVMGQIVTEIYRFTTPQTDQSWKEAATVVQTAASVLHVTADPSTATLTFSGRAEAVDFAAWVLPQIDKPAGDDAAHEYLLPSGDIGRVKFVSNVETPQATQELLTILRTVADTQRLYFFTSNHAFVLCGPEWQVGFSSWIIDQINQPKEKATDPTPREFTVGGPDYRGLGHGARVNFLANTKSQRPMQELLTVLRTVGDVQKVFSYSTSPALVFRAGDTDLKRAEWIIQSLDQPAKQSAGAATFTAPDGDDVTRIFHLRSTTPEWTQSTVTGLRSEVKIKKIFATMTPDNIVLRGTTDQIAAAMTWMTSHNALFE